MCIIEGLNFIRGKSGQKISFLVVEYSQNVIFHMERFSR